MQNNLYVQNVLLELIFKASVKILFTRDSYKINNDGILEFEEHLVEGIMCVVDLCSVTPKAKQQRVFSLLEAVSGGFYSTLRTF